MMLLPLTNDHFGFKFGELDFEGRIHPGDDYNGPGGGASDEGTPLQAIAPGVVTYVSHGTNGGWGNLMYYKVDMKQFFIGYDVPHPEWCPDYVYIQHAHCKEINVEEGDKIEARQIIATLGGTGEWSPHLHWEVRKRPLGVYFYPSKSVTIGEIEKMYFNPTKFVAGVNEHITTHQTNPGFHPDSDLIQGEDDPKIYFYNGQSKFYIPDWDTFILLFGQEGIDRVEVLSKKQIKNIKEGDPFPSLIPKSYK